jgi:hypothetical protein
MGLIEKVSAIKKTKVFWEYESDDEYLEEMGDYFEEGFDINIELVRIEVNFKKNRKRI